MHASECLLLLLSCNVYFAVCVQMVYLQMHVMLFFPDLALGSDFTISFLVMYTCIF